MTTRAVSVLGASSASGNQWDTINWRPIERQVRRLQMRIAKAVRDGRWGKVRALQWLLTHSFSAKLLGVKRVVHNPGRRTARGGSGCLADSRAEDASRPVMQAAWVSSPTASTPLYPEEKRQT